MILITLIAFTLFVGSNLGAVVVDSDTQNDDQCAKAAKAVGLEVSRTLYSGIPNIASVIEGLTACEVDDVEEALRIWTYANGHLLVEKLLDGSPRGPLAFLLDPLTLPLRIISVSILMEDDSVKSIEFSQRSGIENLCNKERLNIERILLSNHRLDLVGHTATRAI